MLGGTVFRAAATEVAGVLGPLIDVLDDAVAVTAGVDGGEAIAICAQEKRGTGAARVVSARAWTLPTTGARRMS